MQTFTFYSYKGGAGRSLLLANTARYLALLGKRVVAIDLDFEAPGLHYKLNIGVPGVRTGDAVPKSGIVDYLLAATEGETPPKRIEDYLVSVPLPHGCKGQLMLMPAGSAPSGEYWKHLTALFRHDLFKDADANGIVAYLELKARLEEELQADFLLIDSRTGITELAGIATTLLADKVVCLVLNNRESLTGTRAVLRSFRKVVRLHGQGSIEVVPVLSRVPEHDKTTASQVLAFLNEPGPTPEDTLALKDIFALRTDPELARLEKLHVGSGEPARESPLHQDYLALFPALVAVDPDAASSALLRQEAIREMRRWLTYRPDHSRHRRESPEGFREEQIDEGVRFGNKKTRYADLIVYSGQDRAEALMAVEFVDDLDSSDAWQWWENETKLRCVVLLGNQKGKPQKNRIFTRGRRVHQFTEKDDWSGWAVKWPLSFSAQDDPGDRSVASMLKAVQQGEDGYIYLLITEWQHASFVTLHGGMPYRPILARQIIDGLANVRNIETELRVLWRTAPDPFERTHEGMGPHGNSLEEMTTRELHAPLWWRLSADAKVEYWQHSHNRTCIAGIELLARELMGLSFDPDRDFRREVGRLVVPMEGDDEDMDRGAYRFADLFRKQELKYEFSQDAPPELVRQAALRQALKPPKGVGMSSEWIWENAESTALKALDHDRELFSLLRGSDGKPYVVTTNLLGLYDPVAGQVTIYRKLVGWCARAFGIDERTLTNLVFLHETVHALCHLGRDLDGRAWDEFALPSSRDIRFRPSALHEALAQYFSFRLIERIADHAMMAAFERLSDHQPLEYQVWRNMRDIPVESVRKALIRARAGLELTP